METLKPFLNVTVFTHLCNIQTNREPNKFRTQMKYVRFNLPVKVSSLKPRLVYKLWSGPNSCNRFHRYYLDVTHLFFPVTVKPLKCWHILIQPILRSKCPVFLRVWNSIKYWFTFISLFKLSKGFSHIIWVDFTYCTKSTPCRNIGFLAITWILFQNCFVCQW